jgi:hypothetical protein
MLQVSIVQNNLNLTRIFSDHASLNTYPPTTRQQSLTKAEESLALLMMPPDRRDPDKVSQMLDWLREKVGTY